MLVSIGLMAVPIVIEKYLGPGMSKSNSSDETKAKELTSAADIEENLPPDDISFYQNTIVNNVHHTGDLVTIGIYVMGTDFAVSPLQWYVISDDNDKAVLITKDIITRGCYDYSGLTVPFDQSYISNWLNLYFVKDVFSNLDTACSYSLRLLTKEEAVNIGTVLPLSAEATTYALSRGTFYDKTGNKVGWLTKSFTFDGKRIVTISSSGEINGNGITPDTGAGIRPVLELECSIDDFVKSAE